MADSGLLSSFLAAIQASLSVLLVIFYGGLAARLNLLTPANTKSISKVCVRMFLPALLLTQIGSELHAGQARPYAIVLLWAVLCHLVSFLLGLVAHLVLGMPDWTTAALMFNNTTSYPLLLIDALDETGILRLLIVTDETSGAAIARAKAYFLVFATVSSCLTFAVGPRLIDSEHAPELEENEEDEDEDKGSERDADGDELEHASATEQTGLLDRSTAIQFGHPFRPNNSFFPSLRKPSTSQSQSDIHVHTRRPRLFLKRRWARLSPRTQWWLVFVADFFNAPLLGALLGAVIGLSPPLHRAFFADTPDGGIFTAWLTASLKTIGSLFVPLPVVVAGVSLYSSISPRPTKQKSKPDDAQAVSESESQGSQTRSNLPWAPVLFILAVRFLLWPVLSIGLVYALASKSPSILGADPMLWFTLMLMPTGPPAMKLITLVQVSDGAGKEDEEVVAKLLAISYCISPILSFAVVGSLKASQACI
ncbi:auxin efflux carrier [Mycena albidolilacea]|uniref:Auxin efflux carrier n=1 Tax=Mycena albidolilacea TaxID=1033008 RepID=A0AAD7A9X7_9AGAR|nr:auxin efflux carrier [Mycena albidolilacea]